MILSSGGKVSWHCFNCKFKASYTPGHPLSFKFRKLLGWLGASSNDVQRLVIEAMRVRDLMDPQEIAAPTEEPTFAQRALPPDSISFLALAGFYVLKDMQDVPDQLGAAVDYVFRRHIDMEKYEFFWTPSVEHKMSHRVIVPFVYKGQTVGYVARAVNDAIKPKYHAEHPANFVFNMDNQKPTSKFVIVCEGTFDAMSVDGVSVQQSEISEQQADIIESLGKEVIVLPDFDEHVNNRGRTVWPGKDMIKSALNYGWSVSFPAWRDTCKDANAAVTKYGKLFTLKTILAGRESNSLKIKIKSGMKE